MNLLSTISAHMESLMANLHVRNLDETLVRKLKVRAAENGRSTEAEHREILRQALEGDREADRKAAFMERAARLRALSAHLPQTPSEILQREGRDEAR